MEVLYSHCAGLDVHKKTVVVCRLGVDAKSHEVKAVETFGTTTAELLRLSDWLTAGACTHAAMESTGEFWKPIWNLLEGNFELLLVNAQHIKRVPGRKTDVQDSEWLADLHASEIPCGQVRSIGEVLADPQVLFRGMIQEVDHATLGRIKTTGVPVKLSDTPGGVTSAPPLLGAHTEQVLRETLGMSAEEISALRESGAV